MALPNSPVVGGHLQQNAAVAAIWRFDIHLQTSAA
jgi:hypothetical protein